jgi:hypothetical protein
MTDEIRIGERVQVYLNARTWGSEGWFAGTVVRIDPYSAHRSFTWVELDAEPHALPNAAARLISVLNPKNIRKISP